MYCPRCGQQQVVNEVNYCARCGFLLGGVAVLLANEGAWPAHVAPPQSGPLPVTPRRKGVRQGGMLMFLGAALVPILGILGVSTGIGGEFALLGVILFIAGLARLLYAAVFQDNYPEAQPGALPPTQQPGAPPFQPAQARASLPQHHAPAPTSFRRRDTAELVRPPASVTENTTRLLDDQADTTNR